RLLSLTLDGKALEPRQPAPESVWLPQPASTGAHAVRLRWRFDDYVEPLPKPNLAGPRFDGLALPANLWVVHIPAGYQLAQPEQRSGAPMSAADFELRRAESFLRLTALLALRDGGTKAPADAQIMEVQRS